MIFSNLKAGSNFNDDEMRTGAGLNGVGSVLTNVFSTEFIISTCDGNNHFYQVFSNNMRDRTTPKIKKSTKNHTQISYKPDFKQFGLVELDDIHFKLIEKRVYDVAACNPKLKIYFNNKLINIKTFEDYIKLYVADNFFFEEKKDKTWSVGICNSDHGFQQVSFVNSTDTTDGGQHMDFILNQIIKALREFFMKKHKIDVKPSELKNHIFLFVNSTIQNPSFNSQTKEKLITEVKDFGTEYVITDFFIKKIINSEIVKSVLDWYANKKEADENKELRKLNSSLNNKKVTGLVDANYKIRKDCELIIYEGLSAAGCTRKLKSQKQGFFCLKGKFINSKEKKITDNDEAINLIAAIGLKIGQQPKKENLKFGKILIGTDMDTDGDHITALLINFFSNWIELFEWGMIYRILTPLLVIKKKNKKLYFYKNIEFENWNKKNTLNGWEVLYKKGLGSLEEDEFKEMLTNTKTIQITKDDLYDKNLNIWFSKDDIELENRKRELLKK